MIIVNQSNPEIVRHEIDIYPEIHMDRQRGVCQFKDNGFPNSGNALITFKETGTHELKHASTW